MTEQPPPSRPPPGRLGPISYLVLGLLAAHGPLTPYELKTKRKVPQTKSQLSEVRIRTSLLHRPLLAALGGSGGSLPTGARNG